MKVFFFQCTTSEYAQETDCIKLLESSEPQTNDGLASGVEDSSGGSDDLGRALFGEQMEEAAEG